MLCKLACCLASQVTDSPDFLGYGIGVLRWAASGITRTADWSYIADRIAAALRDRHDMVFSESYTWKHAARTFALRGLDHREPFCTRMPPELPCGLFPFISQAHRLDSNTA